jgi:TonB dependent receptor
MGSGVIVSTPVSPSAQERQPGAHSEFRLGSRRQRHRAIRGARAKTRRAVLRRPHDATATFEKGNPDLKIEVAESVELVLRRAVAPFRFEITAYYTRFGGFIFRRVTGNIVGIVGNNLLRIDCLTACDK